MEANLRPDLLAKLAEAYERDVTPEDFFAYIYGILAHPAFTERYAEELATRELRVPITGDPALFGQVRDIGAKLLWLHTYGQRFVPKRKHAGQVPKGKARCTKPVPGDKSGYPEKYDYDEATKTLHVGTGAFAPVAPAVYNFEVSGLKVVQSWLGYRMKKPKGKKSSPLDDIRPERWTGDFTTELLELLWILEATTCRVSDASETAGCCGEEANTAALNADRKSPDDFSAPREGELDDAGCFTEAYFNRVLPPIPDWMRQPPKPKVPTLFDGMDDD